MDYADGTVVTVYRAEERKGDGVVTAKGDKTRQCLSVLCWSLLFRICGWLPGEEGVVAFFDLMEGPCVVVSVRQVVRAQQKIEKSRKGVQREDIRSDRNITTVQNSSPTVKRIRLKRDIISTTETNSM
jgi:hypothetical protein